MESIIFCLITLVAFYFAFGRYKAIFQAIQLGKEEKVTHNWTRVKNMLLFALGQRKMFSRPVAGIFHLFIYLAFIITQIELLEVLIDGIFGLHRTFSLRLAGFYTFLINFIEVLSILALLATFVFLIRRNVLKLPRFTKAEMKGWPFLDANIILIGEIILVMSILMINGSYLVLTNINPSVYPDCGQFLISGNSTRLLFENIPFSWLVVSERLFWWLHYLTILGFIIYLPYSKHLHIFLAFPNSYFASLQPNGKINNIPTIENEARTILELAPLAPFKQEESFGAGDIHELSWINILQSFSCTECGRCTSVCPANNTGKILSPRKVIMDVRDRAEEIIKNKSFTVSEEHTKITITDGKSLFDKITKEELYACTTCNACVEACPVLINPLQVILELRRYDILMRSEGPQEWLAMFNSLENNQAAWTMSESRIQWINN
jgi:heterodisulfide reductase subunit C